MFSTNNNRRSHRFVLVALIGTVCIATVTTVRAAPMLNHPPQSDILVPLSGAEGISLGSVGADGDCVVEHVRVLASGSTAQKVKTLTCAQ